MIATSIAIKCVDDLAQIRDELECVWLALGNTADAGDSSPVCIREHVHGLRGRVQIIAEKLQAAIQPAPVRMVGGERS